MNYGDSLEYTTDLLIKVHNPNINWLQTISEVIKDSGNNPELMIDRALKIHKLLIEPL